MALVKAHGRRVRADDRHLRGRSHRGRRDRDGPMQREGASSEVASELLDVYYGTDIRALLPAVSSTAVLHREQDTAAAFDLGREVASLIPGAQLVPLPGPGHLFYQGEWSRCWTPRSPSWPGPKRRAPASPPLCGVLPVAVRALRALLPLRHRRGCRGVPRPVRRRGIQPDPVRARPRGDYRRRRRGEESSLRGTAAGRRAPRKDWLSRNESSLGEIRNLDRVGHVASIPLSRELSQEVQQKFVPPFGDPPRARSVHSIFE